MNYWKRKIGCRRGWEKDLERAVERGLGGAAEDCRRSRRRDRRS
tara:strand:- start:29 stop:160 length:132 start_codon:yes stop_codon:yes gene_type:complete